jgi:signal peptidase I
MSCLPQNAPLLPELLAVRSEPREDGGEDKPPKSTNRRRRVVFISLRMLVIALLIRTFIGEASLVPTASMENTVMVGDHLFWIKALYGPEIPFTEWRLPHLRHVRRGEIVAFRSPQNPKEIYLKRAIATGGDVVAMHGDVLSINGVEQKEGYARYAAPAGAVPRDFAALRVPAGELFVLGDNRDNSADSREFGFVPEASVLGEPIMILWSYDAPSSAWLDERPRREFELYSSILLHLFSRTRWSRVGTVL